MTRGTALAVMARYPTVGEVKTRLAQAVGAARACALYRAFLEDIDARFSGGPRTLIWFFDPPHADFRTVVASGSRCEPQRGADLAKRLRTCCDRVLRDGFEQVIVIGADVPHIPDIFLDEADAQLDSADVVLGPSSDGGYYLVAMRAPHDVFTGVEMGTHRVLAQTLTKASAAGLRVHLLPQYFDIDEVGDLDALRRLLRDEGYDQRLPRTAAALTSWDAEIEMSTTK